MTDKNATSSREGRTPRRPTTARPETADSGVGDVPLQEFYPEGRDIDEEDFDDGEPVDGVFAFTRPTTAISPQAASTGTAAYETDKISLSHDGDDDKADSVTPIVEPVLNYVGRPSTHLSSRRPSSAQQSAAERTSITDSVGQPDIVGWSSAFVFDPANPPPFSGVNNLNNSAFTRHRRRGSSNRTPGASPSRGATAHSRLSHLHTLDRLPTTAEHVSTGSPTSPSSSGDPNSARAFRPFSAMKHDDEAFSYAPSTYQTDADFASTYGGTSRPVTGRQSHGFTEITGDSTVPEGFTTWGDGDGRHIGHQFVPEYVEEHEINEDSPYAEVRASVSNIDDPTMPGELPSYRGQEK